MAEEATCLEGRSSEGKGSHTEGTVAHERSRRINTGAEYRRVRPADFIHENVRARNWLSARLHTPFSGPTVVITHHAPVTRSLGEGRRPSLLDAAYANAWDDLMGLAGVWIHGHIHQAHDFEVGGTRIIANPRGYPGEATRFEPRLLVTV